MRTSVARLVQAMSDGDVDTADAVVAPEPRFEWFFVNGERDEDSGDRSTLRGFLEVYLPGLRRLDLSDFGFSGYRAEDRTGHFGFRLEFVRTDAVTEALGKGAIDCDSDLVMVWSVGPEQSVV